MGQPTVRMLGTRGVPGNHGGFETAAENIAKHLVDQGWRVVVYCQTEGGGAIVEDKWEGIDRVIIPVDLPGWRGVARFDWLSIDHACRHRDLCLTFGYNSGIYNFRQRLAGIPNIINMDGLEWQRKRWGPGKRALLYVNERLATLFGNHLVADHPAIESYLLKSVPRRKLSTITYGAHPVPIPPGADSLAKLGLEPGQYLTLIARPTPENSVLEIVRGFSARSRGFKLAVLGNYQPNVDRFHRAVMEAASGEVRFLGPIYGEATVPIRYHGRAYLHGHTVGGTNPSLVEALAAGNPVIAHDNPYNRWVARDAAVYFHTAQDVDRQLSELMGDERGRAEKQAAALARFNAEFTWTRVAGQYETLLRQYLPG